MHFNLESMNISALCIKLYPLRRVFFNKVSNIFIIDTRTKIDTHCFSDLKYQNLHILFSLSTLFNPQNILATTKDSYRVAFHQYQCILMLVSYILQLYVCIYSNVHVLTFL